MASSSFKEDVWIVITFEPCKESQGLGSMAETGGATGVGCQIITSDLKFNEEFGQFIVDNGLAHRSNAYHVVSIIGGQSSGKSTILNNLFGTSFDMMNSHIYY